MGIVKTFISQVFIISYHIRQKSKGLNGTFVTSTLKEKAGSGTHFFISKSIFRLSLELISKISKMSLKIAMKVAHVFLTILGSNEKKRQNRQNRIKLQII